MDPDLQKIVEEYYRTSLSFLPENAEGDNVLNGIAFDGEYYYFTGKDWPVMYKMEWIDDKAGGMTP